MNLQFLSKYAALPAFILIAGLLTGCAGGPTKNITAEDRATIKTVKLNPAVQMPPTMFFHGRAQSAAMVGGIIGALAGAESAKGPSGEIVALMQRNQISLPDIVKTEFKQAATKSGSLAFADNGDSADAELILAVNMYGLGQTQGFSALLYPVLNLSATLKKKDGTIIWQKTDFATPNNSENTLGHEFEAYVAKPELLRQTLTNISGVVSRMLLKDLQKQ